MKPITSNETHEALARMLHADRVQLAGLIERLPIHRDILKSPAATIAELATQAEQSVRVIEYLEKRLAELGPVEA